MMEFLKNLDFSPLWISLKTGVVATIFSFFLGIYFAYKVMGCKGRAKSVLDGILTLPLVLPPTVAGFLLLRLFSVRRPFGFLLQEHLGIQVVQTWLGCVVAAVVISLPLMYKNARAAFEQVDKTYLYAAQTLGISQKKDFLEDFNSFGKTGAFIRCNSYLCKGLGRIWSHGNACGKYSKENGNHISKNCHGNARWRLSNSRILGGCDWCFGLDFGNRNESLDGRKKRIV